VTSPAETSYQPGDIIFLTIKSEDTEEVATTLSKYAPQEIPLFCFQNGVRNEEIASQHFSNIYGGVLFFSGTYLRAGEIAYTQGDRVGLGVYPSGVDELAQKVCEILKTAGFRSFWHQNIMAVKWSKLVINLGMAVNAITGLSGEEATASKESREFIADVTDEGVKVMQAAGIVFEEEPGQPPPAERGARLRAMSDSAPDPAKPEEMKHRCSTWQDIALKRGKTEVDFINGEVIKLGEKLGIPTPLNSLLLKLVKEMTQEGAPTGKYSISDLKKMLGN